jgi:hypothetical protein
VGLRAKPGGYEQFAMAWVGLAFFGRVLIRLVRGLWKSDRSQKVVEIYFRSFVFIGNYLLISTQFASLLSLQLLFFGQYSKRRTGCISQSVFLVSLNGPCECSESYISNPVTRTFNAPPVGPISFNNLKPSKFFLA